MAGLRGLFVQRDGSNNGTTPKGARLALAGLLARSTSGTVQPGVLVDGMGPVVSGTGAMSYSVRACTIVTKSSDANGPVVSSNDAAVSVATTDAPGSNSRIDAVYAMQDLVSADGGSGTSNDFTFGVVQGTVAAVPTAPAIPSGATRLANVTVTAGVTTTSGLTFSEPTGLWTTANGGIVPTARGSRLGRAWDGIREGFVPLGLLVAGKTAAQQAISYTQFGRVTQNTDASGLVVVNLAQPFASEMTLAGAWANGTPLGAGGNLAYTVQSSTTSTLTIEVRRLSDGARHISTVCDFSYIAAGR